MSFQRRHHRYRCLDDTSLSYLGENWLNNAIAGLARIVGNHRVHGR
jgi:hypothetical protein